MKTSFLLRICLLFLYVQVNVFAIEGKIRVNIKENTSVYTSQKVIVSVEILSNAFSITDVKINFPPSDTYIIQAPSSAAYLGSEESEGRQWQLIHYEYALYALKTGKVDIPTVSVSFTSSMGYGQEKQAFALKSDALSFEVQTPKGIYPKQFILVTDKYSLKSEMTPARKKLIVGDAVTLRVTQKAHDVLDIVLKPIVYSSNAFVRVYEKEPQLKSGITGEYDVSRVDTFTFVATKEGNVTFHAKTLFWWDAKTEKLHKETIPSIDIEIIEDPQIALDAQKQKRNKILFYLAMGMVLLFGLYFIFKKKMDNYFLLKRRRYEASEKGKFEILLRAIEKENLSKVYTRYHDWLGVMGNKDKIEQYIENNHEIKSNVLAFEASLVSRAVFDKKVFTQTVHDLRKIGMYTSEDAQNMLVKRLNP